MTKRRRLIWWGVLAAGAALLIALGSRSRPAPVELAPVVRGALSVTLDEEGETRVRDRFVISAPVAGRLLRIDLEPGDPVLASESVLAAFLPAAPAPLDSRGRAEAEAAVGAAEAALGSARALYEQAAAARAFAESNRDRLSRLHDEGVVSAEQRDAARLESETAQEALEAAEFGARRAENEVRAARARLLRFRLRRPGAASAEIQIFSPVDGVVLRRLRESESVVPAGEPLLEVGDPRELEVVTDYLSNDAVRIRAGQPALVDRWGGERPLAGRVRRVEPAGFTKISALGVEEQRVNVVVELTGPQAARAGLGDGYRVETRVVVWEAEDQVKVPGPALFRRGEEWAAFVVEGDLARERTVEIGERNQREAQVLAGLEVGDLVVLYPSDSVADGARVTPAGDSPPP